jgi:alpha-L-fucosidase 2
MKSHATLRGWALAASIVLLTGPSQGQLPPNTLPLRIGADQAGDNVFHGEMAAVRLYHRPLTAEETARLAAKQPDAKSTVANLVIEWLFGGHAPSLLATEAALPAQVSGRVSSANVNGIGCARFDGGWFTVEDNPMWTFPRGFTLEAWVRPTTGSAGRIVDKITPGGSDGWLLDTHPGDSLRFIGGAEPLVVPFTAIGYSPSPTGAWLHVAAVVDPSGTASLFANGRHVAGTASEEGVSFTGEAPAPGRPLTLWYRQPARRWVEASVIGSGRLGGMVWGGVTQERIDLNEDTLWSGEPYDNLNTNGLKALPALRALLLAGKNSEAQAMVESNMNGQYNQCYQPLGDLRIAFPITGEVANYRRELDLETAVVRTTFEHRGASFTREVFASNPSQVIIVRLTSSQPGRISFIASLHSQLRHTTEAGEASRRSPASGKGGTGATPVLRLLGRAPAHADPNYKGKEIIYDDAPDGKAMRFETRLLAVNEGGSVKSTDQSIVAENCDRVTLLLVAATSYNGPQKSPSREGKDPARLCKGYLEPLAKKSFTELRAAHIADHQRLFNRVFLDLGRTKAESLPTDVRLRQFQPGSDPALAALYFQFGRYLLIAGSRPDTQPLNLQGIWSKDLNPAWSANWTLNCNAQINYWPVEAANLGECHEPLIDLTTEVSADGTNIAKNLYGARGWIVHHNTDIWRQAGPVAGSACWSVFQGGSGWLCQHVWEHYAFSGDIRYLRRVWPVLAGAARFYLDAMIEEPSRRWLVTAPDVNFENGFRKPDGTGACSCYGPTATMQMVRELFKNCLAGSELLGTDDALRAEIEQALPRLAPMQISPTTGELQEWVDDWQRTAACQVLSSWGAICSGQITPRGTPDLAAGLRKIFDDGVWWRNGLIGSWQGSFQANVYARLHDGELALAVLEAHLQRSPNPNLLAQFNGYCEFQIDGNLGHTAAIVEMLLQSQTAEIELLPALPKAWPGGSAKGLRARGGFELDLAWSDGQLTSAVVRSVNGTACKLRCGQKVAALGLKPGGSVVLNGQLAEVAK